MGSPGHPLQPFFSISAYPPNDSPLLALQHDETANFKSGATATSRFSRVQKPVSRRSSTVSDPSTVTTAQTVQDNP
ncbi:unnamed protein product [Chondrus crispus]|uniref:Uncharacterized protein n=1 Tax=Chondrus crispus TaxID=2769 RepID=R7QTY2_CHOCR|nr:unnamed protein product [Chondrus crispus]CDF40951.1 unnamed protein product [Chondrus crispus]|eukprot:XP_005711245.1 unnamed protein product [Chondrus crispus]